MQKSAISYLQMILHWLVICHAAQAQYLLNPSVEGTLGDSLPPIDWYTDDDYSDPDLLNVYYSSQGNRVYNPVDGDIFLLLRATGATYNETHHGPNEREYLYQSLARPIEPNSCFRFDVNFAFNSDYEVNDSEDPNVAYPLKFMLYGGNQPNSREKLLIESDPIRCDSWELYTFYFYTGDTSFAYILLETSWDTINIKPQAYNGMLLMDNLALTSMGPLDTINEHTVYYRGDGETQLTAANGLSFSWTPDNNLFPSDSQLPLMLNYHDFYKVYIDRDQTCPSVELFNVILDCDTIYGDPLERYKEYYYKYDTLAQLRASSGETWNWEPQVNLTAYNIQSPRLTDFQKEYTVTITDKYNCTFTDHFNIILNCDTLYPESTILVIDTLVEHESSFTLDPLYGIIDGLWSPDRFLDCSDCQSAVATPRTTTTYLAELNDQYGCKHSEVFHIEVKFRVPNVITPNDDGYNDCLKIFGLPDNTAFRVYDKNGLLLYGTEAYPYDFCWNGVDQGGNALKAGTYWYALDNPSQGILKKGFILIKR